MTKILNHLTRDCRAASAAEFALVLPLLLLFLLGMLDVGRLMWTWNRAEKATQMGVRYAVVADLVASGIKDYSTLGLTDGAGQVLTQGDTLEDYDFGSATCEITGTDANASPTCGCTSGSCAWRSALVTASPRSLPLWANGMTNGKFVTWIGSWPEMTCMVPSAAFL